MLKRAKDMKEEIREQMRGGMGSVKITHVFQQEELGGRCRLLAKLTLEPGASIGKHVHENEEEIFYIMQGTARVDDNGTQVVLGSGDALLTGDGKSHGVENIGHDLLEIVAVILLYVR